jgi:hypothetical protein
MKLDIPFWRWYRCNRCGRTHYADFVVDVLYQRIKDMQCSVCKVGSLDFKYELTGIWIPTIEEESE